MRATANRKFRATIGTSGPWRSNQEAEAGGARRVQLPTADKLRDADRLDGEEGLEPEVAAMLAATDRLVRQYQEELCLKHELERVQKDSRASTAEPRVGAALPVESLSRFLAVLCLEGTRVHGDGDAAGGLRLQGALRCKGMSQMPAGKHAQSGEIPQLGSTTLHPAPQPGPAPGTPCT